MPEDLLREHQIAQRMEQAQYPKAPDVADNLKTASGQRIEAVAVNMLQEAPPDSLSVRNAG